MARVMQLWTCQMAKWRKAKEADIVLFDTTVKSGLPVFAPTWEMVGWIKQNPNDLDQQERYTRAYQQLMRKSWTEHRADWEYLLGLERVAIACYCPPGQYCHRLLLKDYLIATGERLGITVEYQGEL